MERRRGYGKHIRDREPETEVQPIKLAFPARTSTDRWQQTAYTRRDHLSSLLSPVISGWCPGKAVASAAFRGYSRGKTGRKTVAALLSGKPVISQLPILSVLTRTGPDQFQLRETWIWYFKYIDFQRKYLQMYFFWVQWELNLSTLSDA